MISYRRHSLFIGCNILLLLNLGCEFKFVVPPQKSALENQLLGTYPESKDDYMLILTHRGTVKGAKVSPYQLAIRNQRFNKDDIYDLLTSGYVGEAKDGSLRKIGKASGQKIDPILKNYIPAILKEENEDRMAIWNHTIASTEALSSADLPQIRKNYHTERVKSLSPGQWYEDSSGKWVKKTD